MVAMMADMMAARKVTLKADTWVDNLALWMVENLVDMMVDGTVDMMVESLVDMKAAQKDSDLVALKAVMTAVH
jgi:hypothetical protein